MVFRVRYLLAGTNRLDTETVEAHSPSEAMIKFNLKHDQGLLPSRDTITSVYAEELFASL